jgi:hypothetical protein
VTYEQGDSRRLGSGDNPERFRSEGGNAILNRVPSPSADSASMDPPWVVRRNAPPSGCSRPAPGRPVPASAHPHCALPPGTGPSDSPRGPPGPGVCLCAAEGHLAPVSPRPAPCYAPSPVPGRWPSHATRAPAAQRFPDVSSLPVLYLSRKGRLNRNLAMTGFPSPFTRRSATGGSRAGPIT